MVNYGARELAAAFRTVRKNTVQVAKDIPEDKYDFKPSPEARSVRELLTHIAYLTMLQYDFHRDRRITTLPGYDFGALIGKINGESSKPRNKAEIIQVLEKEGDAYAKWIESLSNDFLNETYTDPMGQNAKT